MSRSVLQTHATCSSPRIIAPRPYARRMRGVGNGTPLPVMRPASRPPADEDASHIPPPPVGRERLAWLGPGFLWMVSAAGSGELLFTPRVGALYGYTLLWALLAAVALKW